MRSPARPSRCRSSSIDRVADHRLGPVVGRLHGHAAARRLFGGVRQGRRCRSRRSVLLRAKGRSSTGDRALHDARLEQHSGRRASRQTTHDWAASGSIDPVVAPGSRRRSGCSSGSLDSALSAGAGATTSPRFYEALRAGGQHRRAQRRARPNTRMLTDDFGSACAHRGLPYINDCDVDRRGRAAARSCYGPLQARNDGALAASSSSSTSTPFIAANHGMAATGWAVRAGSVRDERRAAGCTWRCTAAGRTPPIVGQQCVRQAHRLQPLGRQQPHRRAVPADEQRPRLNGCWDWWGYDRRRLRAEVGPADGRRSRRWSSGSPAATAACGEALNGWHVRAGRARWDGLGAAVAKGSNQNARLVVAQHVAARIARGHFVEGRVDGPTLTQPLPLERTR